MSIADHFEQAPDARCIRDYHAGTARRQLRLSIMLVAAFALAAVTLGTVLRFDSPAPSTGASVSMAHSFASAPPSYAGRL